MSSQDWIEFKPQRRQQSLATRKYKASINQAFIKIEFKRQLEPNFEKVRQRNLNTALLVTSNVTHEPKSWGGLFSCEIIHTAGNQ